MPKIRFKPTAKQYTAWRDLRDPIVTEIGYGGAASGGKTWLGCVWLLIMCYEYPGSRWFMGRKELKNLRRTTLVTFLKAAKFYGIRADIDFTINHQDNIIKFANGCEILLLDLAWKPGDPLWTTLGGLELTGGFIDQSEEVLRSAVDILHTRVGRWLNDVYGIPGRIMESFNPAKNHVYHRYYKPCKAKKLPDHRRFIKALPTDNPYTPASYIMTLKRSPIRIRERLLNGNFEYDDDPNSLFDIDALGDMYTNQVELVDTDNKYITCDSARKGKDRMVIAVWQGYVVIDGTLRAECTTVDTENDIKALCQKHNIPMSHVLVDEGGEGGGVVDHLKCKGFLGGRAPYQSKTRKKRYPVQYQNQRAQTYFKFADYVSEHKIAIRGPLAEFQDQAIEELEQTKGVDLDTEPKLKIIKKDDIKDAIGRSPDFADTFSMRAWFDIRPQPRVFSQKTGVFAR